MGDRMSIQFSGLIQMQLIETEEMKVFKIRWRENEQDGVCAYERFSIFPPGRGMLIEMVLTGL